MHRRQKYRHQPVHPVLAMLNQTQKKPNPSNWMNNAKYLIEYSEKGGGTMIKPKNGINYGLNKMSNTKSTG
uniref:HNH endonuclease n=1 Tax=Globodera pallida TaxID=36090 RepID=A0A183BYN3_GLOPA